MNKTTEALNASFSLLNLIRRDKAWDTDIVDSVLDSLREALAEHVKQDPIDESWCIEPKPVNGLLVSEPVKQEPPCRQ